MENYLDVLVFYHFYQIDEPGFSCGVSAADFYNILVKVKEMVETEDTEGEDDIRPDNISHYPLAETDQNSANCCGCVIGS